jgi:hypothetical protein
MRLHDRLHTHIDEKKVDIHIYLGEKKIRCMLCIYLPLCLSKQLGIAISRTTIFLY